MYLVPGGCTWSRGGVAGPGDVPGPRERGLVGVYSRGVYLVQRGVPGPEGVYLVPGGCMLQGGVSSLGGVPGPRGGVPGPGGGVPGLGRGCTWSQGGVYLVWGGGVPAPGGVCSRGCQVLPPCEQNHRCL